MVSSLAESAKALALLTAIVVSRRKVRLILSILMAEVWRVESATLRGEVGLFTFSLSRLSDVWSMFNTCAVSSMASRSAGWPTPLVSAATIGAAEEVVVVVVATR